jgi:hypothetical protein
MTKLTDPMQKAFTAIESERKYQDECRGNARRDDVEDNRDLGSLILFMDIYVAKAKAAFSGPHPEGRTNALHEVRKVAALATLAMEKHGAFPRESS